MPYCAASVVSDTPLWLCDEKRKTCSCKRCNSFATRFLMRLVTLYCSNIKCVVTKHTAVWSSWIRVNVVLSGPKTAFTLAERRLSPLLPIFGVTENVLAAAYNMKDNSRG